MPIFEYIRQKNEDNGDMKMIPNGDQESYQLMADSFQTILNGLSEMLMESGIPAR
jgi:hypothetical protein